MRKQVSQNSGSKPSQAPYSWPVGLLELTFKAQPSSLELASRSLRTQVVGPAKLPTVGQQVSWNSGSRPSQAPYSQLVELDKVDRAIHLHMARQAWVHS